MNAQMYSNVEFRASCPELAELYCRKGVNHEPPHQSGDLPQEQLDATKHGIAITACRLGARVFSVLGSSISSSQTMKFAATCVNSEDNELHIACLDNLGLSENRESEYLWIPQL